MPSHATRRRRRLLHLPFYGSLEEIIYFMTLHHFKRTTWSDLVCTDRNACTGGGLHGRVGQLWGLYAWKYDRHASPRPVIQGRR